MKTTVISLVLILLVYSLAYPQKLEWLSYPSGNYVSGIYVSALKEEGDFIWAGTTNGLVKIDKSSGVSAFYSTMNSGLPSNVITSIAIDSSRNKWFGTDGGVAKFDGADWTAYTSSNSGLPHNAVISVATDADGNMWLGTWGGGTAKFNGVDWTTYTTSNSGLPSDDIYAIAIDASGNRWFGTGGGLAKFDGTNWTIYTMSNSGLPHNYVRSITIDGSGNKWIGTWGGGLAKFDGLNWTAYTKSNSGLPHNDIRSIAIDGIGNKWIGTDGGGLVKFDGINWTTYTTSNSGLPDNHIISIAIDASDNKWIGTWDQGMAKFDGTEWTSYTTSNSGLLSNEIYAIVIDDKGHAWVGTNGGLAKYDGKNWTVFTNSNSDLPHNAVRSIAMDGSGNIWLATGGGGLAVYHEGGIRGPVIQSLREFSLIEPGNDQTVNTIHPSFRWQQSSDISEYYPWELTFDLYIDTTSSFSQPRIIKDIQDTTYTIYGLAEGMTYFWKVLARNLADDSMWSMQKDWGFFIKLGATSVENTDNEMPKDFELFQNYPNPFNSNTIIKYSLAEKIDVTLRIYDINGKLVDEFILNNQMPGEHEFRWTPQSLASGVYLVRIQTRNWQKTIKAMLLK